ncbi:transcription elongation factor GreA [Arcanobacterium haemolyticum]|uniref:Transcription elongation factor GreA n=1 Tax=Arcanobacterium haemolyticum (strain ATCC 9345 / DSM 20595 / CCM 5947 / CCUG 17215 / LMG 16163 / NBRC 15585 / NCTC 8452 / 11018) TaxID=644284 RepID=D7BKM6_ARCHD|nr:transcription elongation factor GreA [Arcanobacterium haemolyticum]ADH93206.1 GreA/GreB family elongation factor [Arcanobacterium haemolyticum DSM 20595]QCX47251.1 transcription elongation factor GreA [Arcanobacterium haemolyticum]SQH28035.1 Transcript cleavage factor greA [Arcanobacterium haemolyticum]
MADTTWLSQETFDRLSAELEHLKTTGRTDIATKIEEARSEGDLRENGGYHAAREEQSKMEGRIQELTYLLEHAEVGDAPVELNEVAPGLVITAEVNGKEKKFLLGSREAAEFVDIDVYPETAPLGSAIMGKKVGDETSYTAPNGKEFAVKVLGIEPFRG